MLPIVRLNSHSVQNDSFKASRCDLLAALVTGSLKRVVCVQNDSMIWTRLDDCPGFGDFI